MSQVRLPQEESPTSGEGERRSGDRIARRSLLDRALEKVQRLLGSPRSRFDRTRRLVAPLVLALVPLYWIVDATHRARLTTIGRDQGIFQYIAWAVRMGDVDYRDVRDVNGPLIHLIHMVMLALGGGDEHRFHVLDLIATGVSFAIVGALLPGIVSKRPPKWIERAGWALAAWVVLSGQYALFLYWNQAQRESFCDWFLLPSIALQIARPNERATQASSSRRIVAVAALSTITWFGKSSFVFFTVMQLAVILIDDKLLLSRRARLKSFVLGGLLGAVIPLLYLLRYGDILAYLEITLRDVPRVYRYIWARSAPEIFGDDGPLGTASLGLTASAVLCSLVALRALPRRFLALALAPLAGLVSVVVQHKGFGYHFHPVTASTHMAFMVVVAMLWERFRDTPRHRQLGRWVALGVTAAYALTIASTMRASPHTRNVWILAGGETPEKREKREFFDSFKTHDFFPWELRQGARYLTDTLPENARVQVYGMDPYILFLARRRSATPYIYAYDLNADAALEGGWSNRPTWLESEHIRAWRAAHEQDMLARLKADPPEAFVFIDRAPLITWQDAWEDFKHCCKESSVWVATHYHAARSFGEVHVWLRDDLPIPDAEGLP
ncbi:MAG: hypothetical protein BGO98_00010 [Myxococcales bacterium 68-20]|nr:hypothetical protein [Myxococcales bacterium]OJY17325.1 MAG: hypothetical protein BGO98_00010 [Myxococcales bacterium 68-20]